MSHQWTVNKLGVLGLSLFAAADTTQMHNLGEEVQGVNPYWGGATFVYGRGMSSIDKFAPCVCTPTYNSGEDRYRVGWDKIPNTANTGKMFGVAMQALSGGEYGWFMIVGQTPVLSSASVAADTAVGITGAGTLGAIGNGKQILNARCIRAATTTVTKTGHTGAVGSTRLTVANSSGLFPGVFLSGTGIASGCTVANVEPKDRVITLSAALTAAPAGTLTATYNDSSVFYNVLTMNRPFVQGQVA